MDNFFYNGIDRVNNEMGYEPLNVVPCCQECNFAKCKMSKDEFITHFTFVKTHLSL